MTAVSSIVAPGATKIKKFFFEDLLVSQVFPYALRIDAVMVANFLNGVGDEYEDHMEKVRAEIGELVPPDMWLGLFTNLSLRNVSRPALSFVSVSDFTSRPVCVGSPVRVEEEVSGLRVYAENERMGVVKSRWKAYVGHEKMVIATLSYLVNRRPI
jgi:acyl dehydratase